MQNVQEFAFKHDLSMSNTGSNDETVIPISVDIEKVKGRTKEINNPIHPDRPSKIPAKERVENKPKKQLDRNVERSSKLKELTGNNDLDNPFAKINEKPESISNTASHM